MKPLFIILTVLASIFTSSSYAGNKDVTPVVLQSFQYNFGKQKNVDWSVANELYKANFVLNGQYVAAYFEASGEIVALTHRITTLQLPITLQAKLKKEYNDYWVSDLFEIIKDDVTYYITLENADTKIVLQATPTSKWSVYKKSEK